MSTPQKLSQYVQPRLSEARIAHQWAKIMASEQPRGRLKARMVPALALSVGLSVAVVVAVLWHRPTINSALPGVSAETDIAGSQSLTLPDGSRIDLGATSRMVIDEYSSSGVQLSLRQGQASFQVTHNTSRPFTILAADYEVSVIGTRFKVSLGASPGQPRVSVYVEQGTVSMRNRNVPHDERTLSTGESWSSGAIPGSDTNPSISTGASAEPSSPPSESSTESTLPLPQTPMESNSTHAPSVTGLSGIVNTKANSGPKDLFELAEINRVSGDYRGSADALNKLRHSYRSDPRAGLAAFELGRIRMDIFGDLSGSAEALRDAIQLNPNASFREDAESRLVQLYHRQGHIEQCRAAKEAYLKHFPNGAAGKVVSRLCGP